VTRQSLLSSETTGGPHRFWFLRKESGMNRVMGERRRREELLLLKVWGVVED
jgi:hypothetical protein